MEITSVVKPKSAMSLAEFREVAPKLFWPDENGRRGPLVGGPEIGRPHGEFYKKESHPICWSEKCRVSSGRFITEDGSQELLAIKSVNLDDLLDSRREQVTKEFNTLRELNHKHIVAAVGAFTDVGPAGGSTFDILLFPLAPFNLQERLNKLSYLNRNGGDRKTARYYADRLLSYAPCLLRAVQYLHYQDEPFKHRDIKPSNILIDGSENALLADFDIAKKYTNTELAITNTGGFTPMYAPQSVKDRDYSGLEWDIYSLGCVFLEMATLILGETIPRLWEHLISGGKKARVPSQRVPVEVDYDKALREGHVHSWLHHLEATARGEPELLPGKVFRRDPSRVDQFLAVIFAMMNYASAKENQDYDRRVLASAWSSLSTFSQPCEHCHNQVWPSILTIDLRTLLTCRSTLPT
jgi:serine/threonine protein kinase